VLSLETKVPHKARTQKNKPSKDNKNPRKPVNIDFIQSWGLAFVPSEDDSQCPWLESLCLEWCEGKCIGVSPSAPRGAPDDHLFLASPPCRA
jgi:hypothetical protein